MEGFVYHLSNVDPDTADSFLYLIHAKHELDEHLRVTSPLEYLRLTARMGLDAYITRLLAPSPPEGSEEYKDALDRCRAPDLN